MQTVSNWALFITAALLSIPLLISYHQRLRLEKEIWLSTIRGFIQLLLLGYIITLLFSLETWYVIIGLLFFMMLIAAFSAGKRGAWLRGSVRIAFIGICAAEAVSLMLWLTFGIVPFTAQYVFPMSGMIIGNAMVTSALTFERMDNEFKQTKDQIWGKLALGATPRQASQELLQTTIKAALIPSLDIFKTIGLVQIPGMMTGMIMAGASPIDAVRYQIVIMFSLLSSAVLSAMIVSYLSYRQFYKK